MAIRRGTESSEELARLVEHESGDPTSVSAEDLEDAGRRLRDQEQELARYRAAFSTPDEAERVSAALPRTADGVAVVPGMEVWVVGEEALAGTAVPQQVSEHVWLDGVECFKGSGLLRTSRIYSNREAARAAADERSEG